MGIAHLLLFVFALFFSFCFALPQAYLLYDNQDDCNSAVASVEYNGSCALVSDCSRGAFNVSITEEDGACEIYEFGPVVLLELSEGISFASLTFDTFADCNVSLALSVGTGSSHSWEDDCDIATTWEFSTNAGSLFVPYVKGLVALEYSDY